MQRIRFVTGSFDIDFPRDGLDDIERRVNELLNEPGWEIQDTHTFYSQDETKILIVYVLERKVFPV